jgi:hypothetical protein
MGMLQQIGMVGSGLNLTQGRCRYCFNGFLFFTCLNSSNRPTPFVACMGTKTDRTVQTHFRVWTESHAWYASLPTRPRQNHTGDQGNFVAFAQKLRDRRCFIAKEIISSNEFVEIVK